VCSTIGASGLNFSVPGGQRGEAAAGEVKEVTIYGFVGGGDVLDSRNEKKRFWGEVNAKR